MRYLSSEKIKSDNLRDGEIEGMVPWVIEDGTFENLLRKYFPNEKYENILDIGCGNGSALEVASSKFMGLFGLDIVSHLKENIKNNIKFDKVDLNFEKLPYPDNSFDLVTGFQVLEHLENPFLIEREIFRILKKGCVFIFSVPNPYQLTFKIKYLFTGNMPSWTKDNNHLLFLTKDVFAKIYLKDFKLEEIVYQKGAIPFWGRLRSIFGKKAIKKHAMVLPRSEMFGRRVCYVLKK